MLLIYVPVFTPRCAYLFDLVFNHNYGIDHEVTTDSNFFMACTGEKINYSFSRIDGEFYISATGLLFEDDIKKCDIPVSQCVGTTVLFARPSGDINFDVFAAVFYMVSRYEEYLPFTPDQYGRFTSSDSLAYKHDFLKRPVVDDWLNLLREALTQRFPGLQYKRAVFSGILSYDIDIAYAFKGRGMIRTIGATLKDIFTADLKNVMKRTGCLLNGRKDPWDVYDCLHLLPVSPNLRSTFFFLVADYSAYDKNINYRHSLMKELVTKVSAFSEPALHPSFRSTERPEKISIEKTRLEKLSGKKVEKSRQHFLRFTLPVTYNHLIDAGITEDYSMAFADAPGFRAGTCRPFYFYDLEKERPTGLKIFPVTVMDGSYIDYLRISPAEALNEILTLMEEVNRVQGTFISIWHNHTISDAGIYSGWKYVHDKMIERLLVYTKLTV